MQRQTVFAFYIRLFLLLPAPTYDYLFQHIISGLVTVKYIYDPAAVGVDHDAIIGSSISGRIEGKIGLGRLTTIAMPMKG